MPALSVSHKDTQSSNGVSRTKKGLSRLANWSATDHAPMRRRLTEIANEAGTDKGTVHGDAQGYTLIYEMLFEPMRDRALSLLEIGLAIGGPEHGMPASRAVTGAPSAQMWRGYFPKAKILGIDISDFSRFESEWFKFYKADCGDGKQLDEVVAELSESGSSLDIIVDDASHASFHQQLTMLKLFPLLKVGGFYIIEDLNWQPERYEAQLPEVPKTSKLLAGLLEKGRFANTGRISEEAWQQIACRIGSTILIDEDYLLHLRRAYNLRSGVSARQASYMEKSLPSRLLHRKNARHIYEQMRRMIQVCLTGVAPICAGRIALAIIQKV